ncbi:MAG TPA: peptidase C45, partial [Bacteroidia bacterium]|nr:peptidase C45 [Bacteroidia bacterium]
MPSFKGSLRFIFKFLLWTVGILIILFLLFLWRIQIPEPVISSKLKPNDLHRIQTGADSYRIGNNWLRKNQQG